jgi:hypothetical protein
MGDLDRHCCNTYAKRKSLKILRWQTFFIVIFRKLTKVRENDLMGVMQFLGGLFEEVFVDFERFNLRFQGRGRHSKPGGST